MGAGYFNVFNNSTASIGMKMRIKKVGRSREWKAFSGVSWNLSNEKMGLPRSEMIFYRLKTGSETVNVAEVIGYGKKLEKV